MRTPHKWTVQVQSGAPGNEVKEVTVTANWDPDHPLTESSVMCQGEFYVKAKNKFKYGAAAIPDSVELVAA